MPPLLLSEDESVALALALRSGTEFAASALQSIMLDALTKVERLLPASIRQRVERMTSEVVWSTHPASPELDLRTLTALMNSRHDGVVVRLTYVRADQVRSARQIEPHHIVARSRRWYLVGWDLERQGWRSFRLDRIVKGSVEATRQRFDARELPAESPAEFISASAMYSPTRHKAILRLRGSKTQLETQLAWIHHTIECEADTGVLLVCLEDESATFLAAALGVLGANSEIELKHAELDEQIQWYTRRIVDQLTSVLESGSQA